MIGGNGEWNTGSGDTWTQKHQVVGYLSESIVGEGNSLTLANMETVEVMPLVIYLSRG